MSKNPGDVILRDRMEFDVSNAGDRSTVYGRIDLSQYISVTENRGLAVKAVYFQVREQSSTALSNTGVWDPVAIVDTATGSVSALKIYATTRAYENASDVGIASPDVLCVREWTASTSISDGTTQGASYWCTDTFYGPMDLHPSGYVLVSDLLIGVAMDNWRRNDDDTLEVDILLIAESVKVTKDRMNEMLTQAQDL